MVWRVWHGVELKHACMGVPSMHGEYQACVANGQKPQSNAVLPVQPRPPRGRGVVEEIPGKEDGVNGKVEGG